MIPASRYRFIGLILILFVMNLAITTPSYGRATPNLLFVNVRGFHLISPNEGWLWTDTYDGNLLANYLYWTKDSGQTWTDITPSDLNGMRIRGIAFVDNRHGSIIGVSEDPVNYHAIYSIVQTTDGGKTWITKRLNTSFTWWPANISLQFLDVDTGWLRVREQTSSNYDTGSLYKTTDGGATWTTVNLPRDSYFKSPIGDPAYFVTDKLGWIAGRTGGGRVQQNLLYRTQDGGRTWQTQIVGVVPSGLWMRAYKLPEFLNAKDGLLTVQDYNSLSSPLEVYVTHNGGVSWKLDSVLSQGRVAKLLDNAHWIGVVVGKGIVKRTIGEKTPPTILSEDPIASDIDDMDFVSPSTGLALANYQICPPNPTPGQCSPQNQLLYTSDGGQTWQHLILPQTATF